jgi:hypothetical protein
MTLKEKKINKRPKNIRNMIENFTFKLLFDVMSSI